MTEIFWMISDKNEMEEYNQFDTEMETEMEKERLREGRQFDGFASANGDCEITGYETNIREECEEVSTIECKKVNVTKVRSEIRPRCKTLFDQKCNVTYNDVPTKKCSPKKINRYKYFLFFFIFIIFIHFTGVRQNTRLLRIKCTRRSAKWVFSIFVRNMSLFLLKWKFTIIPQINF